MENSSAVGLEASALFVSRWGLAVGSLDIVFGLIGFLGNAVLTAAVLGTAELRSKNGLLMALLAISDGGYSFVSIVSGVDYVRQQLFQPLPILDCFIWIGGPRLTFLTTSVLLMLALSLDRLAMVKFPLRYRLLSRRQYLAFWATLVGFIGVLTFVVMALGLKSDFDSVHLCEHFALFHQTANNLFIVPLHMGCILAVLVISLVSMRWVEVALTNENPASAQRKRRFQNSLRIVFAVFLTSWVVSITMAVGVNYFWKMEKGTPIAVAQLTTLGIAKIAKNPNVCSNIFIYYWRNAEYRQAVRKVLRLSVPHSDTPVFTFNNRVEPSCSQKTLVTRTTHS